MPKKKEKRRERRSRRRDRRRIRLSMKIPPPPSERGTIFPWDWAVIFNVPVVADEPHELEDLIEIFGYDYSAQQPKNGAASPTSTSPVTAGRRPTLRRKKSSLSSLKKNMAKALLKEKFTPLTKKRPPFEFFEHCWQEAMEAVNEMEHEASQRTFGVASAFAVASILYDHVGLEPYLFWSADRTKIVCKLRTSWDLVAKQAAKDLFLLEFHKKVDPTCDEVFGPGYCEYTLDERVSHLWRRFEVHDAQGRKTKSIFTSMHRCKLCYAAIHDVMSMRRVVHRGLAVAFFPLHDYVELEKLRAGDGTFRQYFGEEVAMYVSFVQHYRGKLTYIAAIGVPFFVVQLMSEQKVLPPSVRGILSACYAFTIAMWGMFVGMSWIEKEERLATQWGTSSFEENEVVRPEFRGELKPSEKRGTVEVLTDIETGERTYQWQGALEQTFSSAKRRRQMCRNWTCIFIMLACVLTMGQSFVLATILRRAPGTRHVAKYIAGFVTSVQIVVWNYIYKRVAYRLTNWENWRTDTQFKGALAFKVFLFTFLNTFNSFFYTAFGKRYDVGCSGACVRYLTHPSLVNQDMCPLLADAMRRGLDQPGKFNGTTFWDNKYREFDGDCIADLRIQLIIVFGSDLVIGNFFEIVLPAIIARYRTGKAKKHRKKTLNSAAKQKALDEQDKDDEDSDDDGGDDGGGGKDDKNGKKKKNGSSSSSGANVTPTDSRSSPVDDAAEALDDGLSSLNDALGSLVGLGGNTSPIPGAGDGAGGKMKNGGKDGAGRAMRSPSPFEAAGGFDDRVEQQAHQPQFTIFEDYAEIVIQMGYVTLFVASFPITPVFALLNTHLEVLIDTNKLLRFTRRPVAHGAQDIGVWFFMVQFTNFFSVMTNGAVFAFTTPTFDGTGNITKVAAFCAFCAGTFIVVFLARLYFQRIPEKILTLRQRQKTIADVLVHKHKPKNMNHPLDLGHHEHYRFAIADGDETFRVGNTGATGGAMVALRTAEGKPLTLVDAGMATKPNAPLLVTPLARRMWRNASVIQAVVRGKFARNMLKSPDELKKLEEHKERRRRRRKRREEARKSGKYYGSSRSGSGSGRTSASSSSGREKDGGSSSRSRGRKERRSSAFTAVKVPRVKGPATTQVGAERESREKDAEDVPSRSRPTMPPRDPPPRRLAAKSVSPKAKATDKEPVEQEAAAVTAAETEGRNGTSRSETKARLRMVPNLVDAGKKEGSGDDTKDDHGDDHADADADADADAPIVEGGMQMPPGWKQVASRSRPGQFTYCDPEGQRWKTLPSGWRKLQHARLRLATMRRFEAGLKKKSKKVSGIKPTAAGNLMAKVRAMKARAAVDGRNGISKKGEGERGRLQINTAKSSMSTGRRGNSQRELTGRHRDRDRTLTPRDRDVDDGENKGVRGSRADEARRDRDRRGSKRRGGGGGGGDGEQGRGRDRTARIKARDRSPTSRRKNRGEGERDRRSTRNRNKENGGGGGGADGDGDGESLPRHSFFFSGIPRDTVTPPPADSPP